MTLTVAMSPFASDIPNTTGPRKTSARRNDFVPEQPHFDDVPWPQERGISLMLVHLPAAAAKALRASGFISPLRALLTRTLELSIADERSLGCAVARHG